METRLSTDDFTRELASRHRVILLGGMAIIAHGFSRPTKDSDIWLEPFGSAAEWTEKCLAVMTKFPGSFVWSLAERRRLETFDEILADITDYMSFVSVALICRSTFFANPTNSNWMSLRPSGLPPAR